MDKLNTKTVATAGVLLALSVVTLFGATLAPGIELTLYAISSVYVAIILIEFKHSTGWLFYFASVMLTFIVVPNKAGLVPYTIFFGIFPIIKYYIEGFNKISRPVEIIAKLIFCNLMFGLGFIFFGEVFTGAVQIPDVALPILLVGGQVFFLAYDYLLTLLIGFYLKKRPKV